MSIDHSRDSVLKKIVFLIGQLSTPHSHEMVVHASVSES